MIVLVGVAAILCTQFNQNYYSIPNIRHVKIEKMEDEFKGLLSNLEYYKSMYNSSNSNTYIGLYNNTLKDYNNRYNEYEQAIGEYNDIVADYNALLK